MRLEPSDIKRIETACALLAGVSISPSFQSRFPRARLLQSPDEIEAIRDQLPATLLPFMLEGQAKSPDIYAFDLGEHQRNRVVAWNDHAVVADWDTFDAFLDWLRE